MLEVRAGGACCTAAEFPPPRVEHPVVRPVSCGEVNSAVDIAPRSCSDLATEKTSEPGGTHEGWGRLVSDSCVSATTKDGAREATFYSVENTSSDLG